MARRGRKKRDEEEGREGKDQNGEVPQQSSRSSPTNPRHQVVSYVPVDSPSFALKYSSRHAQKVPCPGATLRPAKRVTNSEKSTSRLPPQTQGSEDHHSAPLQAVIDNFLTLVFSQAQMDSPAAPSRYPFRHVKKPVSQTFPTLRTSKRLKIIKSFNHNMLAETEDVPNTENFTSEEHQLAASLVTPINTLINNLAPTGLASIAPTINASEEAPLMEATVGSNKQNDEHLVRSLSFNLSEMAELFDDSTSSQNEVEFPGLKFALVTVDGYRVKEEVAPILRSILSKHGDIAANCSLQTMQSRSSILELVCGIIQKLEASEFRHITPVEINSMCAIVGDLECVRLEVGWLRQRLDDLSEAKQLVKHSSTLKKAKAKNKQVIEETEKELETLEEENEKLLKKICLTKDKLAAMKAEAINLNETVLGAKTKVGCFCRRSLVEGLL